MIRTRGLGRSFGALHVLRGIELAIAPGERVALLGRNGSGKTTLLRVLSGLLAPTAGDAWIEGCSVIRAPLRAKARLGFLPAVEGGFFPRFTGRENLEFFAALRGLAAVAVDAALERVSPLASLRPALETPFHHASSGMKQALGLARALLGDPAVLLLDEPTRSLDPEAAAAFRSFLAAGLPGKTILFVTHAEEEAALCATRTLRLEELSQSEPTGEAEITREAP
ncbi:MAG: ABC transporter ATP-binding protein [Oligoflexia bacterium]|nr:ABC transporter ATP-binding protein [Oligoflexia bacterium]